MPTVFVRSLYSWTIESVGYISTRHHQVLIHGTHHTIQNCNAVHTREGGGQGRGLLKDLCVHKDIGLDFILIKM